MTKTQEQFSKLLDIMHRLRKECPWDQEQTFETLKSYCIEEAYEVVEAIDQKNYSDLKDELGDLMLQVVFQSELAQEQNHFSILNVLEAINEKMIRRHPHVFGEAKLKNADQVLKQWGEIKSAEKKLKKEFRFSGVPKALPALMRGQKLGEKAAQAQFDWKSTAEVFEKIEEECGELKQALKNRSGVEEELGDVLFTLCQFARHEKIDAEGALRKAAMKFEKRFASMESLLLEAGKKIEDCSEEEKNETWEQAKRLGISQI